MIRHIALTSTSSKITAGDLQETAAALQKQLLRDFQPLWHIKATISAFSDKARIPVGYWPIVVQDSLEEKDALGFHTDSHHQPYALVAYASDWTDTVSHELLEMLVDPFGNMLVPVTIKGARVRVLVELCDPCEAFSYLVNGVQVSDFITMAYLAPQILTGRACSFMNKLPGALTVAAGGYLSWLDSDGAWWQETWFSGGAPIVEKLGADSARAEGESLRHFIDKCVRAKKA